MKIKTAGGVGDALYVRMMTNMISDNRCEVSNSHRELLRCRSWYNDKSGIEEMNVQYVINREKEETNQYEDTMLLAGIEYNRIPPLVYDEDLSQHDISINNKGKKLCVLKLPYYREAKGVVKNDDIQPDIRVFQKLVTMMEDEYHYVIVGTEKENNDPISIIHSHTDLRGKTNVLQLMRLVQKSDMVLTQCGHLLPMAESLNKKVFVLFSHRMRTSTNFITRTATPAKVITKGHVVYGYDDEADIYTKFKLYAKEEVYKNQATDLHFKNLIKDKRVVVFGSAPSCLNNDGKYINKFDTIVRVNGTDTDINKYHEKIGSRTDIHYSFYGSSIKRSAEELKKEGCKLLASKIPYVDFTEHYNYDNGERKGVLNFKKYFDNFRFAGIPLYLPHTWDLIEECGIVNRMLTSGVSAIRKVLTYKPKELYITGFDFFQCGYHNIFERWKNGNGGHKTESEMGYVKKLYVENKDRITLDTRLRQVLGV